MDKDTVINELAYRLADTTLSGRKRDELLTDLYNILFPDFENIINSYMVRNNLTGFTFDLSDYHSALGQSIMEALKNYDIQKGDYVARLKSYAYKRFRNVTQGNLADKRFDKSRATYSVEEMFDNPDINLRDINTLSYEYTETFRLVSEFISKDKEGKIIEIIYAYPHGEARKFALEKHFGKPYEAYERKKVQRVRERLAKHLAENGVFI